jgi:peroxiredoxin Q/BCP
MLRLALVAVGVSLLTLGAARADDVKVGDKAPKFTATDETGKDWKSEDHIGKKIVVVYFFPAAFTGG